MNLQSHTVQATKLPASQGLISLHFGHRCGPGGFGSAPGFQGSFDSTTASKSFSASQSYSKASAGSTALRCRPSGQGPRPRLHVAALKTRAAMVKQVTRQAPLLEVRTQGDCTLEKGRHCPELVCFDVGFTGAEWLCLEGKEPRKAPSVHRRNKY